MVVEPLETKNHAVLGSLFFSMHFQQWEMATTPNPHVTKDQPKPARTTPAIMRDALGASAPARLKS